MYVISESSRLRTMKSKQKYFRVEVFNVLQDAVRYQQITVANEIGKRVRSILPSQFGGSPGHNYQHFQDTLAMLCYTKSAIYFIITLTFNPNWPEVKESLLPGQSIYDRPDPQPRIFHQKLKLFFYSAIYFNQRAFHQGSIL